MIAVTEQCKAFNVIEYRNNENWDTIKLLLIDLFCTKETLQI